jgi:hypothetical protein
MRGCNETLGSVMMFMMVYDLFGMEMPVGV